MQLQHEFAACKSLHHQALLLFFASSRSIQSPLFVRCVQTAQESNCEICYNLSACPVSCAKPLDAFGHKSWGTDWIDSVTRGTATRHWKVWKMLGHGQGIRQACHIPASVGNCWRKGCNLPSPLQDPLCLIIKIHWIQITVLGRLHRFQLFLQATAQFSCCSRATRAKTYIKRNKLKKQIQTDNNLGFIAP